MATTNTTDLRQERGKMLEALKMDLLVALLHFAVALFVLATALMNRT